MTLKESTHHWILGLVSLVAIFGLVNSFSDPSISGEPIKEVGKSLYPRLGTSFKPSMEDPSKPSSKPPVLAIPGPAGRGKERDRMKGGRIPERPSGTGLGDCKDKARDSKAVCLKDKRTTEECDEEYQNNLKKCECYWTGKNC